MALEEQKTAQAQETMDSVVAAGHDKSLAEYAKYKGREMQGTAKFIDSEGGEVGTWSQNREDVNIVIDCEGLGMKRFDKDSVGVEFDKKGVSCTLKRFDVAADDDAAANCGEFEEDENVINIRKDFSYGYNVNESTWFIEDSTSIVLSLVKRNVNEAWERLGDTDEEVVKFRDYEKVGKAMANEDDEDTQSSALPSAAYDSDLSIVNITSKSVKVNFALTPKKVRRSCEERSDILKY